MILLSQKRTLLFFTFFLLFAFTKAQTIYVKQGATGSGNSWSDATGDLKQALTGATYGDVIWVAQGIYTPTSCSDCEMSDREVSFIIQNGVELYGGFAGTESQLDERNIEANPTILSGNIDGDITPDQNSYSVIYTQNVSSQTVVDGFIIEDGYADLSTVAAGQPVNSGAGWFNDGAVASYFAFPIIRNCTFRNHFAATFGGAVLNDGAFGGMCNPVFDNCQFINCEATLGGGAMYNNAVFNGECSPSFTNCNFQNNRTTFGSGGAVNNEGAESGISNPSFFNCTFNGNEAGISGGAIYNFGKSGTCSPSLTDVHFFNNSAQSGGAIYNDGTFQGNSSPNFVNCEFIENHCTQNNGGAICNNGINNGMASPFFENCTFHQNYSESAAGVLFNNGSGGQSSPSFINCVFSENLSHQVGAVMYNLGTDGGDASPSIMNCLVYRNEAYISAAGIYNLGSNFGNASPIITNCTFYGNKAPISGAVYNNANDEDGTANAVITNCIFWANEAPLAKVLRNIYSHPTIDNCIVDVTDCDELNSGDNGILNCGNGMLYNQNPLFVDAENNDFHLLSSSPAIDAGNATNAVEIGVDLDGLPRIEGLSVDLGVYEFSNNTPTAPEIVTQPFDQELCENLPLILTVEATSPLALTYQWLLNGQPINGATNATYQLNPVALSDAGTYQCQVSNSQNEVILSDEATIIVNEIVTPTVSVESSASEICEGSSVNFQLTTSNTGVAPNFEWLVNGVGAGNSTVLSLDNVTQSPEVYVVMTSDAACATPEVVSSPTINVEVTEAIMPAISIEPTIDTLCEDNPIPFIANTTNGGVMPVYEWFVNDIAQNENSAAIVLSNLSAGDLISCQLQSSEECATPASLFSEDWVIDFSDCIVNTEQQIAATEIEMYPNPASEDVYLTIPENVFSDEVHVKIYNSTGRIIESVHIKNTFNEVHTLQLNIRSLTTGTYTFKITDGKQFIAKQLLVF